MKTTTWSHGPFASRIPVLKVHRLSRQIIVAAGIAVAVQGQTVAPTTPGSQPDAKDEAAIVLSPFEVTAATDTGYVATETLAGSRLKTDLKDVATQVNVMTKEFMEDLAITNLDDAMQYSLNTETRFDIIDLNNPAGMGLEDSLNVVGGGQGGRTRGLAAPNNSHDFFDTFVRMDSYNTERFTFASGPNSILFGNSSPAGTIDTTFKRAQPRKQTFELSTRANLSTGSVRLSTDLNQPIVKDRLAVRVAGLTDRDKNWRKPAFANQDRLYTALTYAPAKWVTIRAYNERGRFNQKVATNTLLQDHVTPWMQAGRPLFNNHINSGYPNNALPGGAAQVIGGVTVPSIGALTNNSLRRPNAPVRAIISYNENGFLGTPIAPQGNMALGIGYNDLIPAPNNLERSVVDPSIYPFDRYVNGDGRQARFYSWVRGGIVELNPLPRLFIEGAYNEEKMRSRGAEFMDGRTFQLQVDPNMYLNDRVTPNPMVGRTYIENAFGGVNSAASKNYGAKTQKRVSASYELNFENRPNWMRWLGHHRAAGLFDELETTLIREVAQVQATPAVVDAYAFLVPVSAAQPNTLNNNAHLPGFRYYFNPATDDWSVKFPFDVMRDGVFTQPGWVDANGKQVYFGTFDPAITPNVPTTARSYVKSWSFGLQSYWLQRRLVTFYGRRRDSVDNYADPAPTRNWNFDELIDTVNWQLRRHKEPVNTVKSAVLHPFSWLSLAYSETTSEQVGNVVILSPDGSVAPTGAGVGKDYGITLRWQDKFSIRVNKYENSGIGQSSSVANGNTPTQAASGGLGPNFKQTIAALERSIQVNAPDFDPNNTTVAPASTIDPRFEQYQRDLALFTLPSNAIGSGITGPYTVLSDSVAKGYELTLTANPTRNWRIAVTGAKNTASESNIGGAWFEFVKARLPVWASPANLAGGATPSTTVNRLGIPVNVVAQTGGNLGLPQNFRTYSQVIAAALANFQYISDAEGRLNNNIRKYRFTATTRYSFSRGGLKGLFLGANYVWRSPAAVGYPVTTATPTVFTVPGLNVADISVSDIDRPYRGGALTSLDGFLGYSRRLGNGKYHWRVQLNIRNLLDRDDLLVQRVSTDGVGVNFTPQEPRAFILTNTFSF